MRNRKFVSPTLVLLLLAAIAFALLLAGMHDGAGFHAELLKDYPLSGY